jgi:hypothetical protein
MRAIFQTVAALIMVLGCSTSVAWALKDARLNAQLLKLDPQTRLEQTCDVEVMDRINRDSPSYQADRIVAYTFEAPVVEKRSIDAPGAAFRSHGKWYHLSFRCVTGPKRLDAHFLDYDIGDEIPQSQWTRYNLYD